LGRLRIKRDAEANALQLLWEERDGPPLGTGAVILKMAREPNLADPFTYVNDHPARARYPT
jgi:hypothetical protein